MLNFKKLVKSFRCAFKGVGEVFKTEQNFRLHVFFAVVVLFFAVYFQIKVWQWALLLLLIAMVLILEMMNTIFERLSDMLKPRVHEYVREIKDIMSATVLIISLVSAIIGILIFWPYFFF